MARAMVVKNKGILAADESTSTITKRFDGIKLESTEEHRRGLPRDAVHRARRRLLDQRRHSL